jgi:hypothetical protein
MKNLCKLVLKDGGDITPLIVSTVDSAGTGLMNPSIYNDKGILIMNLRHVNYTLYHCEGEQLFNNRYGPLSYLNPENDVKLRTWNYICTLNNDLTIQRYNKVDTATLDIPPVWTFIGLEDARLFRWNDILYLCGCRRDVKSNGESRMELSELSIINNIITEISRIRIDPPKDPDSYCEKNWMPILDMPYHFVKWTNPTEVVQVNPNTGKSKTIFLSNYNIPDVGDFRGSSQVITIGDYRICIIHEVCLWFTNREEKDAKYVHRFIVWDKNWNIVKLSDQFSFMDGEIEFCCGIAIHDHTILITFGFQDNAAFILKWSINSFSAFIELPLCESKEKMFNLFSPVRIVNFEDHIDRRQKIKAQLTKHKIKNYEICISTKITDDSAVVSGKYLKDLSIISAKVAVSHLRIIKEWYENKNDPYLIVLEDDISFETCTWWNFTWREFIENLPTNWDCIQLGGISDNLQDVKLIKRQDDIWSVMAYMITRAYAKKIIDLYCRGSEFLLEIPDSNIQPHIENLIYHSNNTYFIPLFVENINFNSTITDRIDIEKHQTIHTVSYNAILNWWKSNGKKKNIKDLLG